MNWEVITFGNGEFLRIIFNAVAMIFGDDSYGTAVATAALMAFVAWLIMAAFDSKGLNTIRWFIGVLFFFLVVVVPKTTVIINDKVDPSSSSVVSNVPLGLAATAGFFSTASNYLATSLETVLGMPNTVRYTDRGLLFAQSMIESVQKMRITDGRIKENVEEFTRTCVFMDGLTHRRFTADQLLNNDNLATFYSNNVAENVAFFTYRGPGGSTSVVPCRQGWTDNVLPELEAIAGEIIARGARENFNFFRAYTDTDEARIAMTSAIHDSVAYLTGVSRPAEQLTTHMALVNSVGGGWVSLSQELDYATQMQGLVLEKAETERRIAYHAVADIAGEMLPMMHGIFEAFIYAVFPVMVLMAFASPAKVSMGYAKALAWISLWPVIYTILHSFVMFYDQHIASAIAGDSAGGITAISNTVLLEKMLNTRSTVSYLAFSTPLIAWMLVSQSGAMMASFAGRALQGYDQSISSAAGEAASGNLRVGGMDYQTTNTGFAGQAIQKESLAESGVRQTVTAEGREYFSAPASNTALSESTVSSFSANAAQSYSQAQSAVSESRAELVSSSQATLAEVGAIASAVSNMQSGGQQFGTDQRVAMETAATSSEAFVSELSDRAGVSQETAQAWTASMAPSIAGIGGGVSGQTRDISKDDQAALEKAMTSEQVQESLKNLGAAYQGVQASFGFSDTDTGTQGLNAALTQSSAASETYRQSVTEEQRAASTQEFAQRLATNFEMNSSDALISSMARAAGIERAEVVETITGAAYGNGSDMTKLDKMLEMTGRQDQLAESGRAGVQGLDREGAERSLGRAAEENRAGVQRSGSAGLGRVEQGRAEAGVTNEKAQDVISGVVGVQQDARQDLSRLQSQDNAVRDEINRSGRGVESEQDRVEERVRGRIEEGDEKLVNRLNDTSAQDVVNKAGSSGVLSAGIVAVASEKGGEMWEAASRWINRGD